MKIDDLCNLIAFEQGHGATPSSVRRCLNATYKVILQQMKLDYNHEISFRNFGKFQMIETIGGDKEKYDINAGRKIIRYHKPKKIVKFSPSSVFLRSMNENDFKIVEREKKVKKKTRKQIQADYDAKRRPPKEQLTLEEMAMNDLQKAIDKARPPKKKSVRSKD